MENILVDAGPLIALFDRSDRHHEKVISFLKAFRGQLLTTWPVITETLHMLDFNVEVQIDFMRWMQLSGIKLVELGHGDWVRLIELTEKYADIPMDLADATLIIVSDMLDLKKILTIDSDFYVYRNIRKEYLQNVLV